MSAPVSQAITRKSASNLALAFALLPRPRRQAMSALYAFCREVDDIADNESVPPDLRRERLAAWRADLRIACDGGQPMFSVNRELAPFLVRHRLRFEHFDELIRGVEMDLDIRRYVSFSDLELYCYRVASVVGLLSIEIFGYRNPACRDYAVFLGKALQLTNILRDVGTDAQRGRIYLPLELLRQFQVQPEEILQRAYSTRFRDLSTELAARARSFYRQARDTLPPEDRPAMIAAELMGAIYWRLLRRIEVRQFRVLELQPLRLSRCHKLGLILWAWWARQTGSPAPGYGRT